MSHLGLQYPEARSAPCLARRQGAFADAGRLRSLDCRDRSVRQGELAKAA
jgi:hypothetical protein